MDVYAVLVDDRAKVKVQSQSTHLVHALRLQSHTRHLSITGLCVSDAKVYQWWRTQFVYEHL